MDNSVQSYEPSINPMVAPRVNLSIYCFICGIAYKANRFLTHYTECKQSFHQMPLGKTRPVNENELFIKVITKLKNGEDIFKDLEEYHEVAEELYFNLLAKECPNCHCEYLPEVYLSHADACLKPGRNIDSNGNNERTSDIQAKENRESNQRKKRKRSMDNLKRLTRDEVKGFKKLNIKHFQYKEAVNYY